MCLWSSRNYLLSSIWFIVQRNFYTLYLLNIYITRKNYSKVKNNVEFFHVVIFEYFQLSHFHIDNSFVVLFPEFPKLSPKLVQIMHRDMNISRLARITCKDFLYHIYWGLKLSLTIFSNLSWRSTAIYNKNISFKISNSAPKNYAVMLCIFFFLPVS